jgi:archaellum component FlaF (FlaF/FlaG flagellin family)
MRTTHTTCLRRRRGISTILGTLIFIGVLFTAVIPMFLVMKQADNIYIQNVHEMEISDQDRAREAIEANVYPDNINSNDIYVEVTNTGVVPVDIVRVWVNDEVKYSTLTPVASQDTDVIGPITIQDPSGSYIVTLTTKRGNSFAATSETLSYDNSDPENEYWYTPSLGIHIIVTNAAGKYKIWVETSTGTKQIPYPTYETTTSAMEHGEIECTQLVDAQADGSPHDYKVYVQKKAGNDYINVQGTPVSVVIKWPGGSPVINVIVDGRGT